MKAPYRRNICLELTRNIKLEFHLLLFIELIIKNINLIAIIKNKDIIFLKNLEFLRLKIAKNCYKKAKK